jgi:hypothetical protein
MVKNRSTTPPNNPFSDYKGLDNKGSYVTTTSSKKNDKPSSLFDGIGKFRSADLLLKSNKPLLVRLHLLLLQTFECRDLLTRVPENVAALHLPARMETTTSWPKDLQQALSQQLEAVQHCIQALRPKFRPACWQPLLESILESVSLDPRHREVGPPSTTTRASDSVPVPNLSLKSRNTTPHFPPKMPPKDFRTIPLQTYNLPSAPPGASWVSESVWTLPPFSSVFSLFPAPFFPGNLYRWIQSLIQRFYSTAWDFWDICTDPDIRFYAGI